MHAFGVQYVPAKKEQSFLREGTVIFEASKRVQLIRLFCRLLCNKFTQETNQQTKISRLVYMTFAKFLVHSYFARCAVHAHAIMHTRNAR